MQASPKRKSLRSTLKQVNYAPEAKVIKTRGYLFNPMFPLENRRGLKYQSIPDEVKNRFVEEVLRQHGTIKSAAEKFELNFSTAKAILHTYRKEGRVGRKIRRHNKNSCFLKIKKRSKTGVRRT